MADEVNREQVVAYLCAHQIASTLAGSLLEALKVAEGSMRAFVESGPQGFAASTLASGFATDMKRLKMRLGIAGEGAGERDIPARAVLHALGMTCQWLPESNPVIDAVIEYYQSGGVAYGPGPHEVPF